jgi:hypothetical protein
VEGDVRYIYPDRVRLPLGFDPVRLRADLATLGAEPLTPHFVPQNYSGDWGVLPLRAPAGAEHPILMIAAQPDARDFVDTPPLARTPYLRAVLARFDCRLRSGPDRASASIATWGFARRKGWCGCTCPSSPTRGCVSK